MPVVRLSRTFHVSSAHRLHSHQLTDEENEALYGRCHRLHGHNYKIKLTVKGQIDPVTGMVINIHTLKEIAEKAFVSSLDHHHLDQDVPYFHTRPSTVENLVVFVWKATAAEFKRQGFDPSLLWEVEILETDSNSVVYRGEGDSG